MKTFAVRELCENDIRELLVWRYPAPYDLYNLREEDTDEAIAFFLDPVSRYFGVEDTEGDRYVALRRPQLQCIGGTSQN